ncbi:MAG: endolytic transglycosylase MltG [Candidatus Acidiferrales bacterium]
MPPRPSSPRRLLLLVLALLVLLFLILLYLPYPVSSGEVVLVIEQGMSRRAIADRLAERGLLASRWPFLLYVYTHGGQTLKAGEYSFRGRLSALDVFDKLARGEVHLYPLTIPEGYTRWEMADEVARLALAPRAAFLTATENVALIRDLAPEAKTLEGYLFPDTYYFARPADPAAMARAMVERFRAVYAALQVKNINPHKFSPHQLVTLASLVEEETGIPEERGLVAAVFYNRLARNMPLACDPTVIYAKRLANGGEFDGFIRVSDLERRSSYNTYLHPSLPPGPIASPGRAALAAALSPHRSDYLYFVSNLRGGHVFASTSGEHERNVARYRRLRAQQDQSTNSKQ